MSNITRERVLSPRDPPRHPFALLTAAVGLAAVLGTFLAR
jgi:hypothetical protein